MIFVPVRMMSVRDMEELRRSTTSVTRHDFVLSPFSPENEEREAIFARLGPALANAISVPLEAFTQSAPESMRLAGRTGLTETLVEAKVFPTGGAGFAVQVVAQSRDRLSPTLAIFVLSFVGMAVGFYGSFLSGMNAVFGGLLTCALPFFFAMPYIAVRKRAVVASSKAFYAAFRALEATMTASSPSPGRD